MTCMEQGLVQWIDVFMLGVVLGGIAIVVAQFLEKWLAAKLERDRKKLDLKLGEALISMGQKLIEQEKILSKGGTNAPHA